MSLHEVSTVLYTTRDMTARRDFSPRPVYMAGMVSRSARTTTTTRLGRGRRSVRVG